MARNRPQEVVLVDDNYNNIVKEDEGKEIQRTKDYGIGVDTHAGFIQVSVLVKHDLSIFEYRHQFDTDWSSLVRAKEWVLDTISKYSLPVIDASNNYHFCIESTSNYHVGVLKCWGGNPSVVNPKLARSGTKKTDILDAKGLGIQDLTGVWPESYIPSNGVIELRLLISERRYYSHLATQISNRINNSLLALGITIGRDGSVSKKSELRAKVESLLSDNSSDQESYENDPSSCPLTIPDDVRAIFKNEYEQFDHAQSMIADYNQKIIEKVKSLNWETATGEVSGFEMLDILTSVPGVGIQTAINWLALIVTPRRFPNEKAIAAYCGCDPSLKVSAGKVISTVKRGGRKDLHSSLCSAASNSMRIHSEPFGRFGYNIAMQTGIWKKGVSALARKMCVAMYFMMLRGEKFSYEKYKLVTVPDVIDISIETLATLNPAFRRYIRFLNQNDILTTKVLVYKYSMCQLPSIKGLGKNFFALVKDFIENQENYKKKYLEVQNENKQEK